MTDDELGRILFGPGVNSETCIVPLVRLLVRAETDEEFWRIFNFGWCSCDDTWGVWASDLLKLARRRGTAAPFLKGKDSDFFTSLPDPVTIYRGCSAERVRGLAWTTDRSVAADFALGHRGIPVPRPVIATAVVPKDAIFTVVTELHEQEVVVNWRRLRRLVISPFTIRDEVEVRAKRSAV